MEVQHINIRGAVPATDGQQAALEIAIAAVMATAGRSATPQPSRSWSTSSIGSTAIRTSR
jgi:hypothetical protein